MVLNNIINPLNTFSTRVLQVVCGFKPQLSSSNDSIFSFHKNDQGTRQVSKDIFFDRFLVFLAHFSTIFRNNKSRNGLFFCWNFAASPTNEQRWWNNHHSDRLLCVRFRLQTKRCDFTRRPPLCDRTLPVYRFRVRKVNFLFFVLSQYVCIAAMALSSNPFRGGGESVSY